MLHQLGLRDLQLLERCIADDIEASPTIDQHVIEPHVGYDRSGRGVRRKGASLTNMSTPPSGVAYVPKSIRTVRIELARSSVGRLSHGPPNGVRNSAGRLLGR